MWTMGYRACGVVECGAGGLKIWGKWGTGALPSSGAGAHGVCECSVAAPFSENLRRDCYPVDMSRQEHFDAGAGREPVSPEITYTANKHSVKSGYGDRGAVRPGSNHLTVTDPDGKIVAQYSRQRVFGGKAQTTARYTHPEGNDVAFYTPGEHKTVRDRWISEVSDIFGVKF
jgi:hypothetical protein